MAYSVRVRWTCLPPPEHGPEAGVQAQVLPGEGGVGPAGALPEPKGDPGQQLFDGEGFGHVVGGAPQKKGGFALRVGLGAQNDDREALQPGEELLAREAGEHQVQEHQVGPLPVQGQQGLGARVGPGDQVTFPAQGLGEQVADGGVIVYDQDAAHSLTSFEGAGPIVRNGAKKVKSFGAENPEISLAFWKRMC